jgi:hypothetical protein
MYDTDAKYIRALIAPQCADTLICTTFVVLRGEKVSIRHRAACPGPGAVIAPMAAKSLPEILLPV